MMQVTLNFSFHKHSYNKCVIILTVNLIFIQMILFSAIFFSLILYTVGAGRTLRGSSQQKQQSQSVPSNSEPYKTFSQKLITLQCLWTVIVGAEISKLGEIKYRQNSFLYYWIVWSELFAPRRYLMGRIQSSMGNTFLLF